jgi:VWFA-related protein
VKTKRDRVICVTAGLCAFFGLPVSLLAQVPTFRAGTTLVEFTVVALDGKGNPVIDLTQADLALTDRGERREIAFFRFDGSGTPQDLAAPLPPLSPGFVTNRPEYQPEPQRNVTAIVMDLVNTAPPDQNRAREQLLRHLKALPANTAVGLFQFNETRRVTVLAPFTHKADLLQSQMAALKASPRRELVRDGYQGHPIVGGECGAADGGGPVAGASAPGSGGGRGSSTMAEGMAALADSNSRGISSVNQSIRRSRLDTTLANLEALGNHLAAIPGRKSVVWISSGMPVQLKNFSMNYEPPIRLASQRMANQGIAIYPVDAKGNCRSVDTSSTEGAFGLNDATQDVFSTLNVFADVTGGRVTKYDDNLSKGVMLAANDLRGSYTVGFYIPDEPDDSWHPIQVASRRRDVILRHRQGYLSAARVQPQSLSAESWTQLAQNPLGSSAIRLNGRPTIASQQVTMLLQIAAGDLYFQTKDGIASADLEIGVVEKNADGTTHVRQQQLEVTLNDPSKDQRAALITSATNWPVNAGTTAVRVIVRDRLTGRYGTLEVPISNRSIPGFPQP